VAIRPAEGTRPAQGGQGLVLAAVSAASFGTSGALASSLIAAGWSPAAAVTARVAIAALVLTGPAVWQLRGRWPLLRQAAGQVAAYGAVAVAGTQLCYFSAVQRVPVGVALLLEYLAVILVVGWLWLRHGQRPRRVTVAGAVTAITGLVLVLGVTGPVRLDPLGVAWGLLAAAGLATYFVLSAAGGQRLPPVAMAWAGMSAGTVILAAAGAARIVPVHVTTRAAALAGHPVSWAVPVLGLALIAAVLAYVAGIGAARRLGAKLASFAGLAEVLFAVLFAWLLLGQLPAPAQAAGGVLILAGVILVRADELRGPRPPAAHISRPAPHGAPVMAGPGAARRPPGCRPAGPGQRPEPGPGARSVPRSRTRRPQPRSPGA
jgi:drug/metabolite transporter (DMT)-like permease